MWGNSQAYCFSVLPLCVCARACVCVCERERERVLVHTNTCVSCVCTVELGYTKPHRDRPQRFLISDFLLFEHALDLQKIRNNAVCLVFLSSKYDHVFFLLFLSPCTGFWFKKIDYKLSCLCQSVISSTGPQSVASPLNAYVPVRQSRSSSNDRISDFRRSNPNTTDKDLSLFKSLSLEQGPS